MATVLTPGQEPRRKGQTASGLSAEWLVWREVYRLSENKGTPRVRVTDRAHVCPKDALEIVTALWCLSIHDPRTLPDNARLTYAIGQCLFRLAPLTSIRYYDHTQQRMVTHDTKTPAGIAARLIGARIRKGLAVFFHNLTRALALTKAIGAATS